MLIAKTKKLVDWGEVIEIRRNGEALASFDLKEDTALKRPSIGMLSFNQPFILS